MADRDGTSDHAHSRNAKVRRCGVVAGAALGAFVAAAAMATGSAAPAKADLDDFLDPIIQPILTQVTDSLAGFDPTLATDLTSWTDTFLAELNSLDSGAATSSAALAAAASPASTVGSTSDASIPITVEDGTEPTVQATVDGANTTLLVDTGSSGLVIPSTDLTFSQLLDLGFPTGFNVSSYSSGVDYAYLEYDNVPTDYGNGVLDTTGPVDVEVYSWDPDNFFSLFTNDAYQNFDSSNGITGVLGIGDYKDDAGPTESPFQALNYDGVTVDTPNSDSGHLDVGYNADVNADNVTLPGAPIPTSTLTETVTNSLGQPVGTAAQVSDDIDSGGVYGTIPSSIGSLSDGDTVTVSDDGTQLYSYTVENNGVSYGLDESPTPVTGDDIDSGFGPYYAEPIYIDYSTDSITFDDPLA
jgi:hypothetical protein